MIAGAAFAIAILLALAVSVRRHPTPHESRGDYYKRVYAIERPKIERLRDLHEAVARR